MSGSLASRNKGLGRVGSRGVRSSGDGLTKPFTVAAKPKILRVTLSVETGENVGCIPKYPVKPGKTYTTAYNICIPLELQAPKHARSGIMKVLL